MNLNNFKKMLINFIMKKWTCPVICGICIVLIFAMSANSFAKYYTRVQEERAASVAVYGSNIGVDEQFWDKGFATSSDISGFQADSSIDKSNIANGCVRIFMTTTSLEEAAGYLPYISKTDTLSNKSCKISVTNKANGKICEVALRYTITIEFPNEMPNGITWHLRDASGGALGETYQKITYNDNDYYKSGYICSAPSFTFAAGVEEVDTYLIVFSTREQNFVGTTSTDRFFDDVRVSIQTTQITQ